jgi:hypothetical protein
MMHPAVYAIDDGVNALLELVIKAACDETANDLACIPFLEREIASAALDPRLGEASMNARDDIITLSQRTQRGLDTIGEPPSCWTERFSQTKPLELAQPPDHGRLQMPLPCSIGGKAQVDDLVVARGLCREQTVELAPTIRVDLCIELVADLEIAS